jgi:hypothetical protein
MSKKDFEIIASVLAKREAEIEELNVSLAEKIAARFSHRRTVYDLSEALASEYPRFKKGIFQVWALPIFHSQLRREVVARLKESK